jgi:hypothetical protein
MKNKYTGVLYIRKKTYGTIYLKLTFFTFAFVCVDAECRESLMTMNEPNPGNVKAEVGFLWINCLPDLIKLCLPIYRGKFTFFLNISRYFLIKFI